MKPEQPSTGGSSGSLETCTSHRVFFFWMLPPVLASPPAQWATSGSCSAAAACSSLLCALHPVPWVSSEFLVTSRTVCHCLFNRFWKLTYPIFSLQYFQFPKRLCHSLKFPPFVISHPCYPMLPYSWRSLPALAGSGTGTALKWRPAALACAQHHVFLTSSENNCSK